MKLAEHCWLSLQAAGGAARGCAALTSDVEYSNRFRALPMTHRQRLLHGVQSAGVGFYEGAIGIVKEPLVGWQVTPSETLSPEHNPGASLEIH